MKDLWPSTSRFWHLIKPGQKRSTTQILTLSDPKIRGQEPKTLRHYVRAKELKAAGMNWTDVLAIEDENPRARLAAELLASNAHGSTAERVKAFVEQGGGCRATFFNYRGYLLK
jgi:hypothetical protein